MAVGAAVALLLTACGSTVQQKSSQSGGSGLDVAANNSNAAGSTAPTRASGGTGSVGAASVTATGRLSSGSGTGTPTGTGSSPAPGAVNAVHDTSPISLGVLYVQGGNDAIAAGFGNTPVSFGDGQLEANAVADDINAHGGVAGRKVVLHFGSVSPINANNTGLQAACESLTQDNHVFAIMSIFNVRSLLVDCAAKAKAILMDVALGGGDDALYAQYHDWLFTPTQLSLDREASTVLGAGQAAGRITPKAKVGVLVQDDDPMYEHVYEKTIDPMLKGWGVPHESAHIASASSTSDISSAVLRFGTDHVTEVMFSVGNGGIPEVFFMQDADQQQFRPLYEMGDSADTWFVGSQAPAAQRQHIFGAGTYPVANVNASEYPTTPREQHCLDVIRKAGETVSDRHSSLTATFYCELIYGFAAVAARVPGKLTPEGWRASYYGFGTEYPSITTFGSNLSNGRNDNPTLYRLLGYKDSCQCISYLSDPRPLG